MKTQDLITLPFLLSFVSFVLCAEKSVNLYVEQILDLQTIYHGDTIIYYLYNLAPNSQYEVRISYPSFTPSSFGIQILDPEEYKPRDLLNTEKLMFTTDSRGYITGRVPPEKGHYRISVTVVFTGIAADNDSKNTPINFNIVLEPLLMGAPYDVAWIGLFVAVLCIFMATILVPQLFPHLQGFKNLVD